jgi:YgiT-type zinc finger domain-containing protein
MCPRCGGVAQLATVKTAIWRGDRLFVVEDIPAQVCNTCMEQFYDEDTSDALRRLTEEDFASVQPRKEILVPIYTLDGQIRRRPILPEGEIDYADY